MRRDGRDRREHGTEPFWRMRFLIPIYGFGVALVLMLVAGSVVRSPAADVVAAEQRADAAEQQAAAAQRRADDATQQLAELRGQVGAGATASAAQPTGPADSTPTPVPASAPTPAAVSTTLTVRVLQKGGTPLADGVRDQVKLSYTLSDGGGDKGLILSPEGELSVPQVPMSAVRSVCVQAPDGWQVTKEMNARSPNPNKPGLSCLDLASLPPNSPEFDFSLEPA